MEFKTRSEINSADTAQLEYTGPPSRVYDSDGMEEQLLSAEIGAEPLQTVEFGTGDTTSPPSSATT